MNEAKPASSCTVEGLVSSFEVLRHAPSYNDYQWEVIGRGFETWREASEWAHKFIDSRQIERSKIKVVAIINC